MRIPSDNTIPVTAPRTGVLEALALRVGATVTGRVVSQNPNGSTLVQIGNQQVSLNLPVEAEVGQILQFEVKTAGAKPELTLIATLPKPGGAAAPPQNLIDVAAVRVETQSTTQAGSSSNQPVPAPAAYARPLNAPQPQVQSTTISTSPPVAAPPTTIPVPPHVSATLALQSGQVLNVRVAPPSATGEPNIVINGQTIPAPTALSQPLVPGSILQVQVSQQNGQTVLLVQNQRAEPKLYPNLHPQPGAPASAQTSERLQAPLVPNLATPFPNRQSTPLNGQLPAPSTPALAATGQTLVPPDLAQIAAQAATRQDSVGRLIASIVGLKSAQSGLPPDVAKLASQLTRLSINLDDGPPTPQVLSDAVAASGVTLEANLAQGLLPSQQGDMKGLLLLLRNALGNWLGDEPLPRTPDQRPAPPLRGAPPRVGAQPQQPLPPGLEGKELGKHLLSQTDAALSRVRLFQLASLPEAGQRGNPAANQELHFELPFTLGNQTSLAQFQVNRDGAHDGAETGRGWNIVFAVHFKIVGAVGAKISMISRKVGIAIWAENEETVDVLEDMLPELVTGLEALELELASVRVRHHPPQPQPMATGGFLDSVS